MVDPEWLTLHSGDPNLRIVEVDVSNEAYDSWHIDGAVLWNIYRDLKDADYNLVDTASLEKLLSRSGIDMESTVVFYGYAAAMGFWILSLCRHRDIRILDCSRGTWRAEGRPWAAAGPTLVPTDYRIRNLDRDIRVDRNAVDRAIGDSATTLVDVRSASEYRGERFWPSGRQEPNGRAGHIPGALHRPIDGIFDDVGAYRSLAELRAVLSPVDTEDECDLITYCTIGGRAATAWFVLTQLLGRESVKVYDGSWAEWGRLRDTSVECPGTGTPTT